jgi:serine O-acetyltransferase
MKKRRDSLALRCFKFANKTYKKGVPIIPGLMVRAMRVLFACEIPYQVSIGEGTVFIHNALGIVIHPEAKIGMHNKIMQNVTIGGRNGRGVPKIGNYCFIGAGACILGDVTIGDNVMIGANAVVLIDVPDNMVAVGVPAQITKQVNASLIGKFKE